MPRKTRSLNDLQETAKARGGKCLSTTYTGMRSKYDWQCEKGHTWSAMGDSVLNQPSWCPTCAGKFIPKSERIKELEEIAKDRGGKLIGGNFKTCETKMLFKCFRGHSFSASLEKIKLQKTWCPHCRLFRGEIICRSVFEIVFSKPFHKCRPEWLKNSRGKRLELDGFNPDLNLAFEYQGEMHQFENKKHFHKNRSFETQIKNDLIKKKLCAEKGIKLLAINSTNRFELLLTEIKNQMDHHGISSLICPTEIKVDQIKINEDPGYTKLLSMAKNKNLSVISKIYTGVFDKHKFKCNKCNLSFF